MTRVKISSLEGIGNGTKIEAADGTKIPGVEKAIITIQTNEFNRADLIVACVDLTAEAQARFLILFEKELREVKRIEFADGTVWDAA